MTTTTSAPGQWKRLGAILIQRRTALNPQWHGRGAFAEATGLSYRLVYDVEEGRRDNFGGATLAAIEAAYQLGTGTIRQFLNGGELVTADGSLLSGPERPVRTRVNRALAGGPELDQYVGLIRREREIGIQPRPGEQRIWDSRRYSETEKENLIATIRQLDDDYARESQRASGLDPAGLQAVSGE